MEFKKGDKVTITEDSQYRDQGYCNGKPMIGVITRCGDDDWIYVNWYDDDELKYSNCYEEEDLILIDSYIEPINEDVVLIRSKSKRRKIQVLDF